MLLTRLRKIHCKSNAIHSNVQRDTTCTHRAENWKWIQSFRTVLECWTVLVFILESKSHRRNFCRGWRAVQSMGTSRLFKSRSWSDDASILACRAPGSGWIRKNGERAVRLSFIHALNKLSGAPLLGTFRWPWLWVEKSFGVWIINDFEASVVIGLWQCRWTLRTRLPRMKRLKWLPVCTAWPRLTFKINSPSWLLVGSTPSSRRGPGLFMSLVSIDYEKHVDLGLVSRHFRHSNYKLGVHASLAWILMLDGNAHQTIVYRSLAWCK